MWVCVCFQVCVCVCARARVRACARVLMWVWRDTTGTVITFFSFQSEIISLHFEIKSKCCVQLRKYRLQLILTIFCNNVNNGVGDDDVILPFSHYRLLEQSVNKENTYGLWQVAPLPPPPPSPSPYSPPSPSSPPPDISTSETDSLSLPT